MRTMTAKLLEQLRATYPGRRFYVDIGTNNADDRIQLDDKHWFSVDADVDLTMVVLTDETPETGGQIAFWMVRDEALLNKPIIAYSALGYMPETLI